MLNATNLVQSEKQKLRTNILDKMNRLSQRAVWALNEMTKGDQKSDKLELTKEYYEECKKKMHKLELFHDYLLYCTQDLQYPTRKQVFNSL